MEGRIRAGVEGEHARLKQFLPSSAALETAVDNTIRDFIKTTPHTKVFGRSYFSREMRDALGDFPPRMIELEVQRGLEQAGIDIQRGDILDRVFLYRPPGEGLAPNQFRVVVLGDDDEPAIPLPKAMTIDGSRSVYQAVKEETALSGLESRMGALTENDLPAAREDVLDALVMDQEHFRRWLFNGTYWEAATRERGRVPKEFPAGTQALFERSDGRPLLHLFPKVSAEWQRAYDAAAEKRRARRAEGMFVPETRERALEVDPIFGRLFPFSVEEMAKRNADRRAMNLLREEFKGRPPGDLLRAMRTGKLPSEE
jgi:hypothetical protein